MRYLVPVDNIMKRPKTRYGETGWREGGGGEAGSQALGDAGTEEVVERWGGANGEIRRREGETGQRKLESGKMV